MKRNRRERQSVPAGSDRARNNQRWKDIVQSTAGGIRRNNSAVQQSWPITTLRGKLYLPRPNAAKICKPQVCKSRERNGPRFASWERPLQSIAGWGCRKMQAISDINARSLKSEAMRVLAWALHRWMSTITSAVNQKVPATSSGDALDCQCVLIGGTRDHLAVMESILPPRRSLKRNSKWDLAIAPEIVGCISRRFCCSLSHRLGLKMSTEVQGPRSRHSQAMSTSGSAVCLRLSTRPGSVTSTRSKAR